LSPWSTTFATGETVVKNQTSYDQKVHRIENDLDNLGMSEIVGGIILAAAAAISTSHALTDRNVQRSPKVVPQLG